MYKLIAFDAYGTLFDVYSIRQLAESLLPDLDPNFATLWRDRQIEYTRLVTMSDPNPSGSQHYLSFWELTVRSLRYVCKRLDRILTQEAEQALMNQYAKLVAFSDAKKVLQTIHERGIATAILSNGSREMLSVVVQSNGLESHLDQVVSVEDIRLFKTAPQAYQLLLDHFPVAKAEVLFVSSNAWDALAAKWFGYDVFWVNRLQHPWEEIGELPNYEGSDLAHLLDII